MQKTAYDLRISDWSSDVCSSDLNTSVGFGFPQAVRAFMRADPDVIVLGEVRDVETARNAIKAADTGHLVLATLHTGSILGAISRLRDLEVPPHELRYLLDRKSTRLNSSH